MQPSFASNILEAAPPMCTPEQASEIARQFYGLSGKCELLSGERDLNLLLACEDHSRFVVKVSNPAEDADVTNFQTSALCHLETSAPQLPLPRVIRSCDGSSQIVAELPDGRKSIVRVLSFLAGERMNKIRPSAALRANLGRCLAALDLGLANFEHRGKSHDLEWNSATLPKLAPLLTHLDQAKRSLVQYVLNRFEEYVAPQLQLLRTQVIYNDLNAYNVLVQETDHSVVAGIIDFGDIVHAPMINDAAVAASYQFNGSADGLDAVADFLHGYTGIIPLHENEVEVLPDLIAARLATTLLITNWRAERHPENRDYILRNNPPALAALTLMKSYTANDLKKWARQNCDMEKGR